MHSDAMPESKLRLTQLPVEILEQILWHLPGQDLMEIEMVRSRRVILLRFRADSSAGAP